MLPGFWGTWLHQSTLFDLGNTVLASKGPVETIGMNSGAAEPIELPLVR